MTRIKEQAVELLQDIPDEKIIIVIEILKEFRALNMQSENVAPQKESEVSGIGIFHKYANPDLIPLEKEAWSKAVKEKYAAH